MLGDQEARDEVAGEDEEEVDAEEAARQSLARVEREDAGQREPAQPIQGGDVLDPGRSRGQAVSLPAAPRLATPLPDLSTGLVRGCT